MIDIKLLALSLLIPIHSPSLKMPIGEGGAINFSIRKNFEYRADTVKTDNGILVIKNVISLMKQKNTSKISVTYNLNIPNNCDSLDMNHSCSLQKNRIIEIYGASSVQKEKVNKEEKLFYIMYKSKRLNARVGLCTGNRYVFIDLENFSSADEIIDIINSLNTNR
jgi:hypothetical protein